VSILEYGPPLSLATAKRVLEAAEAEAAANQWAMVIAVADSGGNLVALHRMDRAQFGSLELAQAKARSAVYFKRSTKVFEDALAGGGLGLRMLSADGICPFEGGLPLMSGGKVIGAIGVSGATSAQDGQVALVGAKAIGE